MRNDSIAWNFNNYKPYLVTICLGQNDGVQDSVAFCSAYLSLIEKLRELNDNPTIVCLSSPIADKALTQVLQRYIASVVRQAKERGYTNVTSYFFSLSWNSGCDYHPDLFEHQLIANELTTFIRLLMHW